MWSSPRRRLRAWVCRSEAREQTSNPEVKCELTFNWFTAKHQGEPCAGFKTLVDGDRLMGAHLMGPGADEVINLFALAMQNDVPVSRLRQSALAFPTAGYDIRSML